MLTSRDDDVPQCGLNDVEGAQITFLQPVLIAETVPTLSKKVADFIICATIHLP